MNILLRELALTENKILELKKVKDPELITNKSQKLIKFLFYKFLLFFITSFALLLLFWYYLTIFCAVYENSQIHLIKDTLISYRISMLYPLGIYLIPGVFRIYSLNTNQREKMYKFSKIFN